MTPREQLKAYMKENNLMASDIANMMDVTNPALSKYLKGAYASMRAMDRRVTAFFESRQAEMGIDRFLRSHGR